MVVGNDSPDQGIFSMYSDFTWLSGYISLATKLVDQRGVTQTRNSATSSYMENGALDDLSNINSQTLQDGIVKGSPFFGDSTNITGRKKFGRDEIMHGISISA
ncbi:hypothetical protein PanWU01x14_279360 [Parasponia andersonii]|uniref:Uncharacterized protein n=1 Tax=Parasponia andersonii TaxID=3476 RepID=A0A2P5B1W6_PARAD|nr:hypothetical protein PanWU01x14_279360 [Parasponia andersonii]